MVVATRPSVPIRGMEALCGCEIKWIEHDDCRSISTIVGEVPRCMFLGGWNIKAFVHFRDEVRAKGGTAIGLCDNNWVLAPCAPLSWRWWRAFFIECAKMVRFRLLLQNKYDAFFVPGKSGVRVLRFYGVPRERIATGMYTADDTLFFNGSPLSKRGNRIIYVGQFVERKNVLFLARAFLTANGDGGWRLDMYGSGPLRGALNSIAEREGRGCLFIHDFLQPEELAQKYREAKIFCLPSVAEHWGLVVHEAALSGCVLILANGIGAASDMLVKNHEAKGFVNGFVFDPMSFNGLVRVLSRAMHMNNSELEAANAASLLASKSVSVQRFAEAAISLSQTDSRASL